MNWTAPKGMLRREVMYLLNPRPERIRGPKVFVTEAPTLRRRDIEIQR